MSTPLCIPLQKPILQRGHLFSTLFLKLFALSLLLFFSINRITAQDVDLELSLTSNDATPALYQTINATYTLSNTGTATATGISVKVGICNSSVNSIDAFNQNNQIVNGSPGPSASVGTYSIANRTWSIPQLAAGTSATLNLSLFVLSTDEKMLLGEVRAVNETDTDSSPLNLITCTATEDDEASFILNDDGAVTVLPNINVSNVSFDNSQIYQPGDDFTLSYDVLIQDADVPATETRIYLYSFTNGGIEQFVELATFTMPAMTAGHFETFTPTYTIPTDAEISDYQLFVRVDNAQQVDESQEFDNRASPPAVQGVSSLVSIDYPALAITNIVCPDEYPQRGGNASLTYQITLQNNGTQPTFAANLFQYQSEPDRNPYPLPVLGQAVIPALAVGEEATIALTANLITEFPGYNSSGEVAYSDLFFSLNSYPILTGEGARLATQDVFCKKYNTDIELSLSADDLTFSFDEIIDYTITITNNGSETAYNLFTDIEAFLPIGTLENSTTSANSEVYRFFDILSNPTFHYYIPVLGVGETATANITFKVFRLDTPAQLTETVELTVYSGHLIDGDESNNTASLVFDFDDGNNNCSITASIANIQCDDFEGNPIITADVTVNGMGNVSPDGYAIPLEGGNATGGDYGETRQLNLDADYVQDALNGEFAITIIDADDPTCRVDVSEPAIDCTGGTDCELITTITNMRCTQVLGNSFVTADVTVTATGTVSPNGYALTVNGDNVNSQNINYGQTMPISILNTLVQGVLDDNFAFNVTDLDNPNCAMSFSEPAINCGPNQDSFIDLELSVNVNNPNPTPFQKVFPTYTLTNNSLESATNIKVQVGLCSVENGGFLSEFAFNNANGFVYSSPSPATSLGTYNSTSQIWTLPEMTPGQSATLDLTLFTLTAEERQLLGQVTAANEDDIDSTPNNMTTCNAQEDDEAALVINGTSTNTCSITTVAIQSTCLPAPFEPNNNLVTLEINPQGTNLGTNYTVNGPEVNNEVYNYGDFVNLHGYDANLDENLEFTITDNQNANCTTIFTFNPRTGWLNCLNPPLPDFEFGNSTIIEFPAMSSSQAIGNGSVINVSSNFEIVSHAVTGDIPTLPSTFDFTIKTYLSTDNIIDANDVILRENPRLYTFTSPPASSLVEEGGLGNFTLPANTADGDYFIIIKYDADDEVEEYDETNNTEMYAVQVEGGSTGNGVDLELAVTAPNVNPNIFTKAFLTYTLTNTGGETATNSTVRVGMCSVANGDFQNEFGFINANGLVYSSPSPSISAGSYNQSSQIWTIPQLAAGQSATLDITVFLLTSEERIVLGEVQSMEQADIDSSPGNLSTCTINEDDEARLTLNSNPTEFLPDLQLANLTSIGTGEAGEIVDYQVDILNTGNAVANGDFVVGVYLSTDEQLNGTDILVGVINTGNAPIGTQANIPGSITIPDNFSSGDYFLILLTDNDQDIAESNENNNIISIPFTVEDSGCICTTEYDPVCGSDGVTYGNACEAECAGIFDYTLGECPIGDDGCGFNKTYNPPLGRDGFVNLNRTSFDVDETTDAFSINYHGETTFDLGNPRQIQLNIAQNGDEVSVSDAVVSEVYYTQTQTADNDIELKKFDENGNEVWTRLLVLDYPNITGISFSRVIEVADGLVMGGFLVDLTNVPNIRAAIVKTDLNGMNPQLTLIEELPDTFSMINATQDDAGNLYLWWFTSGNFSLSMVDPTGVSRWVTNVAGDTPSTRWNAVVPGANGNFVYAALTDNLQGLIKQINISTGNTDREFNMRTIFSPGSEFSFNNAAGVLPLANGDIITSGSFSEPGGSESGFEYGRITATGDLVWSHRISNAGDLAPFSTTSDGGFLFATFPSNSPTQIIKTTSTGELLPECEGSICICTDEYEPVCGSDGMTYGNACEAECAGIFDYTLGECPTGNGVDLELEIIAPATYNIYTNVTFQARVYNNGNVNAEDVKVSFPVPDGFVHSSNSASHGAYDLFREEWNIGTIKVGETAVLDLNLFALTSSSVTTYAQVAEAIPADVDSTPGNGTCCTPNEDDEAAVTIGTSLQNGNGTTAFVAPEQQRDIVVKTLYPNIATDEVTIFVQSKLSELQARVYNMQGHEVMQQKYLDTAGFRRLELQISELPTGTYFIRFDGSLGRETIRFVKMRM